MYSMKKRGIFLSVVLLVFFLNLFLVSASFILGNKSSSIDTSYSPNEKVRGWINISLREEMASSVINTNFGGNVSLIDFLYDNDADYTCFPTGCESDYFLSNEQARKDFYLNFNQEKILAINLTGTIVSITNFSFKFNVSNNPSCISPFEMNLLDGEVDNWRLWKFTNDFPCAYETGMGCFNYSSNAIEVNITNKFCEKIKLVPSDKFKIGAWVKKVGVSAGLKMELFGTGGGAALASCQLSNIDSIEGEKDCAINYNNTQMTDYYVCLSSNVSGAYSTKTESVNPCGFVVVSGIPPLAEQPKFDYYIFAKGASFSKIGGVSYNQREYEKNGGSGELTSNIMSYIQDRYASDCVGNCAVNCSKGCAIPIKMKTYGSMNISFSDAFVSFVTYSGNVISNKIYDASKISPKISSGFLQLDLEYANMLVPSAYGNQTLNILLGGQTVVSKSISTAKIPVIRNVLPRVIPAAVSTTLIADVYSPANKTIVSYRWDFGDGSEEETIVNSVKHAYPSVDSYTLTLEVEDSSGLIASNEFDIIAGNPKEVVNSTLKKYRVRVNNLTSQINSEVGWIKKILEEKVGIEDINSELTALERKASLAESDDDYSSIMGNLSTMIIPNSLRKSRTTNFPILLNTEAVNFDYLAEYDEKYLVNSSEEIEAYKNAILKWYSDNMDVSADYYTLSANYDESIEPVLTYYKMKITALDPKDEEAYLIINSNANVNPQENIKEFGDSVGIKLNKLEDREIEFISDEANPLLLEVYIAPEFRKLDTKLVVGVCNSNKKCESEKGENWKNCRNDCRPWGWAVFYIFLMLFLAFLSYIGLQEWYKRRYERYLFKNRNDLYNILNFVNNSLMGGMNNEEISKNLKKAGWNSEQISYAMKKVRGKKIGMPFEIGIPKFGEVKRLKQEQNKNVK